MIFLSCEWVYKIMKLLGQDFEIPNLILLD